MSLERKTPLKSDGELLVAEVCQCEQPVMYVDKPYEYTTGAWWWKKNNTGKKRIWKRVDAKWTCPKCRTIWFYRKGRIHPDGTVYAFSDTPWYEAEDRRTSWKKV